MSEIIVVDSEKCVGCNACIRSCPAPEANITKKLDDGRFVTTVNSERCIACGECVRNCLHGARDYIDDTEEAMSAIEKTEKLIILATPSIKTVFPKQWKNILNWFRENGCMVFDVSFGADICTWAHIRAIQRGAVGNLITQPCAAIVKYIETYQPTLLKNLSPIHSPILCSAIFIKRYMRLPNKIAVLSPCVAKKNEFNETSFVEFNVTFQKLMEYFKSKHIVIRTDQDDDLAYNFDGDQGQMGAIYPKPGGLRDNLWLHDPEINIVTSEGVHRVYPELDMYAKLNESKKPRVFDVLSCEFGCNVGAGARSQQTLFDIMQTMNDVEKEASGRRKIKGGFFRASEDQIFKRFDDELMLEDFIRQYRQLTPSYEPTEEELEPIFSSMGKHTESEKNYNCHACGYSSCKAMATAIYRGINLPDNCLVHAKSLLMSKQNPISGQNEKISKLSSDVEKISRSLNEIIEANDSNGNRKNDVHDLLTNVIEFCNSTETMDKESLTSLVEILEKTDDAFNELDKNIKNTSDNTSTINQYISDIRQLVTEMNSVLNEDDVLEES
ncbi:MAG: 4Fe-4S dicluster domain-containing protein [Ruminococcus sp.]|nr:4Fe-4S dicluster domain-containing protein [Ruminococcus sp.]